MKYRQETVAEKDWDGEFETHDEWARFGPQPPLQECDFSRRSSVVSLMFLT
jgi:hypothetical protein